MFCPRSGTKLTRPKTQGLKLKDRPSPCRSKNELDMNKLLGKLESLRLTCAIWQPKSKPTNEVD
jgi:hypothetical protein